MYWEELPLVPVILSLLMRLVESLLPCPFVLMRDGLLETARRESPRRAGHGPTLAGPRWDGDWCLSLGPAALGGSAGVQAGTGRERTLVDACVRTAPGRLLAGFGGTSGAAQPEPGSVGQGGARLSWDRCVEGDGGRRGESGSH